ncbi:DUF1127 domain-containing protein [Vreelandella aquamarina]|jgi:uncharacterized protein YjiS (DUF1127 family)|uniref:YjiS-like domain-containing protein n=1 Tax=Vreelandella aquamarina TaxID=77097 RepID=A0A6F8SXS5_9GAMM|nr:MULTISPECIES: DUF1127 domain-containing protein [Halomonas]MED5252133.1 DUF1127 domain-containing protein [Pseudomonadota bacterium]MCC4292090.1 DUF1127 domain-containing protein [Halomonas axialensis]MCF2914021.1 DUF1127 domain-containing protein [Halomonas sp. Cn5-12]TKJ12047.1 DUF1127 domain-containing protein [Halomonas sp. 15WGF]BBM05435.1 hypothetical protein HAALTHF_15890n [Halomonas axialensis]
MPRFSLTQLRYQLSRYQRSRRQLLTLDDHLLKDIGLTREQACQEGKQTFWKQTLSNKGDV